MNDIVLRIKCAQRLTEAVLKQLQEEEPDSLAAAALQEAHSALDEVLNTVEARDKPEKKAAVAGRTN